MKISYNVTGSKRKELVQAISRELETEAKYCGAPGFAYEVGGLRIDRDGTVSGPDNRGLIADLEGLYSLVPTEKAYETAGISATPSDESDLEPRYTEEELGLGLHHCDPIGEDG
ncbi:MAG: virulence protein, partial [Clostridiales bacterium]|nr:virulence protein [Clostridiales bacterium]